MFSFQWISGGTYRYSHIIATETISMTKYIIQNGESLLDMSWHVGEPNTTTTATTVTIANTNTCEHIAT